MKNFNNVKGDEYRCDRYGMKEDKSNQIVKRNILRLKTKRKNISLVTPTRSWLTSLIFSDATINRFNAYPMNLATKRVTFRGRFAINTVFGHLMSDEDVKPVEPSQLT